MEQRSSPTTGTAAGGIAAANTKKLHWSPCIDTSAHTGDTDHIYIARNLATYVQRKMTLSGPSPSKVLLR